ncbi:Serine carboxypeptidase-like 50 [Linum grandiflorum]
MRTWVERHKSFKSYAGKFVRSIGYYILKRNHNLPVSKRVNLAGIAIGNGLTDPVIQVTTHAATAYYLGLINEKQRNEMEQVQSKAVKFVEMQKRRQAANARSEVTRMMKNMTGLATDFDFTRKRPYRTDLVARFLRSKDVKRKLGVANESIEFVGCNRAIRAGFKEDVMKSVKHKVEFLLKRMNYKVLLYQGSLDLRNSVVASEAWIKTMKWDGIEKFLTAERNVWKVKGEVTGYVQKSGKLSHVVVLGGGHIGAC